MVNAISSFIQASSAGYVCFHCGNVDSHRKSSSECSTMRQLLIAVIAILPMASWAQCTSQTLGSTTFHNCTNGNSGTSQTIGSTTFHNLGGKSVTSQNIGGTTFYNGSVTGTSQRVGGTTFHNINGTSGTSQTIGGTTFHNLGGKSGTSQSIGGTTFNNGDLWD